MSDQDQWIMADTGQTVDLPREGDPPGSDTNTERRAGEAPQDLVIDGHVSSGRDAAEGEGSVQQEASATGTRTDESPTRRDTSTSPTAHGHGLESPSLPHQGWDGHSSGDSNAQPTPPSVNGPPEDLSDEDTGDEMFHEVSQAEIAEPTGSLEIAMEPNPTLETDADNPDGPEPTPVLEPEPASDRTPVDPDEPESTPKPEPTPRPEPAPEDPDISESTPKPEPAPGPEPTPALEPAPEDPEPMVPSVVCVPMQLNAFVLNEALFDPKRKSKIAPSVLPDYAGLGAGLFQRPDIISPIDNQAASPIERNARVTEVAGTGRIRPGRMGVTLHWVLPKGFRSGIVASESAQGRLAKARVNSGLPAEPDPNTARDDQPEFRPVPDRWIICRFLRNGVKIGTPSSLPKTVEAAAFVVESNRIRTTEEFDPECDVEMEAVPFLNADSKIPSQDQDNFWLGCKTTLEAWSERDKLASDTPRTTNTEKKSTNFQSPLTVTASSNPLFADYAPFNTNVFSIHDDLTMYDFAEVNYFVFGYYSRSSQDPFSFDMTPEHVAPKHSTILKNCFMKLADNPKNDKWATKDAVDTRLVCHGSLFDVKWDQHNIPKTVPSEELAEKCASTHPVAIGVDTLDALEAFIDVDPERDNKGLIHEISSLLKAQREDIHAHRLAEKDLALRSFHPSQGGSQWHFSTDSGEGNNEMSSTTLGTADVGEGPVERPPLAKRPSTVEIALLHQLNILQMYYDACVRRHSELQFLLFSEWWKYRAEPLKEDAEFVNSQVRQSQRLAAITTRVSDIVNELRKLKHDQVDGQPGGRIGVLDRRMQRIRGHPNLKGKVKQGVESSFYIRRDPSLVLIDMKNPWPSDDYLLVQLDKDIPSPEIGLSSLRAVMDGDSEVIEAGSTNVDIAELIPQWKTFISGREKIPVILQSAFCTLLEDWALAKANKSTSVAHCSWNDSQGFWPLFVEWEAQYFHVSQDKWSLHERVDGGISYVINDDRLAEVKGIRDDLRTMTGRSLILPQVSMMLKAHVDQLFKSISAVDESLESAQQTAILDSIGKLPFMSATLEGLRDHLTTYVHGTHVAPRVASPSSSPAVTKIDPSDPFSTQVLQLLEGSSADVTPYGRYLDFTHHRRDGRDNNFSPFKPVTHGQTRLTKLNIVDKFGQVVPAMTMLEGEENGYLLPFTSNALACQSRNPKSEEKFFANTVVENPEGQCEFFQQTHSINQDARLNARFVVENDLPQNIMTQKSMTSPVKVQTRDWRPSLEWENPILAWLMVNFRDGGLQIFHGDGTFVAEVLLREKKTYWQPRLPFDTSDSDEEGFEDGETDAKNRMPLTPELMDFVERLRNAAYLHELMEVITDGLDNLHHAPNTFAGELSAVFGRPLALVNMGWSLELAAAPLIDQSTSVNLRDAPKAFSVTDYDFKLKIGDKDSFQDGLIGFFQQKNYTGFQKPPSVSNPSKTVEPEPADDSIDFSQIITDFGNHIPASKVPKGGLLTTGEYPRLKPFFIDPCSQEAEEYERMHNKQLHVFAAIVDPFSVITGYSGILPPKQLQLPAWIIEQGLKQLTPFLSTGPALIPGDIPDLHLLPAVPIGGASAAAAQVTPSPIQHDDHNKPSIPVQIPGGGEWLWLQPYIAGDDVADMDFRAIEAISAAADASKLNLVDGPHTAISGYLQLRTQPPDLIGDGPGDISIDDFGAFFDEPSLQFDISGRGSSGGVPSESVDISITIRSGRVRTPGPAEITPRYVITIGVPGSPLQRIALRIDQIVTIPYARPRRDYSITAVVQSKDTGLTFPIQLKLPVDSSRESILSPDESTFDIPSKVPMGKTFQGTVVLRDRCKNVIKGYDDSGLLRFDGLTTAPTVISRADNYLVKFAPLKAETSAISVMLENEPLDEPMLITALPDLGVVSSTIKGSGVCTGSGREPVDLQFTLINRQGQSVLQGYIIVEIDPRQGKKFSFPATAPTAGSEADESWWTATWPRPSSSYTVKIFANAIQVPGAALRVECGTQAVGIDPERVNLSIATSTRSQTIAVRLLDTTGRRWRNVAPTIQAARLRCRPGRGSTRPPPPVSLKSNRGDGTFVGNLRLPDDTVWHLLVELDIEPNVTAQFNLPTTISVSNRGFLSVDWNDAWAHLPHLGLEEETIGDQYAVGANLPLSRLGIRTGNA